MSKIKQIWIEKLTIFNCLWILIQKKKDVYIFYTSATLLASNLSKFLPNIEFVEIQKGILDKNGKAIIYEIESKTYDYVLKMYELLFLKYYIPTSMKPFQDEWQRILKSHLDSFVKKKINYYFIY